MILIWVLVCIIITIVGVIILGLTSSGGEQKPFIFLAAMIPIIVYGILITSIVTIPFYSSWIKKYWYLNFLFAFGCMILINKNFRQSKRNRNQTQGTSSEIIFNIFGYYSYWTTGYHFNCEGVKHSLRLKYDSTFVLQVYCYADSTSSFPTIIKVGKITKETDSLFNLKCTDNTSFKVKYLNDTTILKVVKESEEWDNYPFIRDNH